MVISGGKRRIMKEEKQKEEKKERRPVLGETIIKVVDKQKEMAKKVLWGEELSDTACLEILAKKMIEKGIIKF